MSAVVLYAVADSLEHLLGGHALLVGQVHSKKNKKIQPEANKSKKKKDNPKNFNFKIQMFPCHLNLCRAEIGGLFF